MSNYEVCRDCEHYSVEDTVLCRDCAGNGFVDLMTTNAAKRWDTYIGEYFYANAAEMDAHSSAIFEAWAENNPEKAGKLIFALFDAELEQYQQDGEL